MMEYNQIHMIDLLKNYREFSSSTGYAGNVRYLLAKKKLDTLFIKWLCNNQSKIDQLFKKAKLGKLKPSQEPSPLFSHHRVPTPLPSPVDPSIAPPKAHQTPTVTNQKQSSQWLLNSHLGKSAFVSKSTKTQLYTEVIPQFYFPLGKPLQSVTDAAYKSQINTIFANKMEVNEEGCKKLVQDVLNLPKYFSTYLFGKVQNQAKLSKFDFNRLWKELQNKTIEKRAFLLLTTDKNKKFLVVQDFKKLFKEIILTHPGLQHLKQAPEFQQWYSLCVINRMFFMANRKNDYKMSFREFKKSKILKSLYDIEKQKDINENKDFFSYEDFYVIYIKFWELDNDHDFLLTKEELSKYSGYTLSRKTIDRIFLQVGRKFQHPEKMTFGDFVWFIYCVEDKTTEQSLQYWFKVLDLDHNGIVAGYQLQYFYEEQSQRLAYMDASSNDFNFENIICQMVDLMKPDINVQFAFEDFLKRKEDCGLFINFLTDLNKLVAFEQRDAYEQKNEKTTHPEWTEWDRFVKPEYKKLQNSGENEDVDEILNWENDDDI